MDPLPSINIVLAMFSQDEKQRELTATLPPTESPITCVVQSNSKKYHER